LRQEKQAPNEDMVINITEPKDKEMTNSILHTDATSQQLVQSMEMEDVREGVSLGLSKRKEYRKASHL
jgi:hypothetical protein